MSKKIRVLVVDDHAVVVKGLQALLATEPDLQVVGTAADGAEAVYQANLLQPDVVLLDIQMPRKTGIDAIREIRAANADARILVLTSFGDEDTVFAAIKAGALGYLLKESSPGELVQAIRHVHQGKSSLHPDVALKIIQGWKRLPSTPPTTETLTAREVDVLKLVAKGLSNVEIADQLTVSERTVRTHISNILAKLNLTNRTQAALYALREGLAGLDESAPPNHR